MTLGNIFKSSLIGLAALVSAHCATVGKPAGQEPTSYTLKTDVLQTYGTGYTERLPSSNEVFFDLTSCGALKDENLSYDWDPAHIVTAQVQECKKGDNELVLTYFPLPSGKQKVIWTLKFKASGAALVSPEYGVPETTGYRVEKK
ncbi:hypothetical protein HZB00_03475 [Candidatus Woesearchaeota archaeon]|nr:hypothetical protein [Candidatus Woesearchaeota archaeon]